MTIEQQLDQLNIKIPQAPKPAAAYVPAKKVGNIIYISGQDCRKDGELIKAGKLEQDADIEEGYQAARQCMINLLAVLKSEVGDLEQVEQIVKLLGFINSAEGFVKQPYVMDGASDLLEEVFGERGKHARSAIAANELPFNTSVEIEMIAELKA
ncbi:RidA family protein [Salicibibacter cibarius]|uniref:RidA family protein n=1 Tax=Salicibibacter cibarius TaxID=2743000 RepID=A0A7T6Z4B1_9BACI|nr:RidA family protein [Salicibibacter cibarius]QQK76659.1 RidA family protein [Salicibibacter cibarius]